MAQPRSLAETLARAAALGVAPALLLCAGCGERPAPAAPAPSPPPAAAPAAAPVAASPTVAPVVARVVASGPTWTLMVTWMSPQQPPATTQTVFHDAAACEKARQAALAEGARLQTLAQTDADAAQAKYQGGGRRYVGHSLLSGGPEPTPPVAPTVAAFCAAS